MTRIISGQWGGRRIATPPGDGTRPTSDRVREAMFGTLQSELGDFAGLRVLDLFAGSGALGLEALSRGAASADFVESDRRATMVIQQNLATLGANRQRVHKTTAEKFLGWGGEDVWDLVFIDPPYAVEGSAVADLVSKVPVSEDALFVVERSSRTSFSWPEGRSGLQERVYGETTVFYGR